LNRGAFAGAIMNLGFDIFKKQQDGNPVWVTQVSTLREAREKLAALVNDSPGEFFARDAVTGEVAVSHGNSPYAGNS
jgi:hypothetical protein